MTVIRPVLDPGLPFGLGEVGPRTGPEPHGAGECGLGAVLDLVELGGLGGLEEEGEVVPQEARLDHDDEEGEDHPVTNG